MNMVHKWKDWETNMKHINIRIEIINDKNVVYREKIYEEL